MLKGTFLSGQRLQGSRWKQEVVWVDLAHPQGLLTNVFC